MHQAGQSQIEDNRIETLNLKTDLFLLLDLNNIDEIFF